MLKDLTEKLDFGALDDLSLLKSLETLPLATEPEALNVPQDPLASLLLGPDGAVLDGTIGLADRVVAPDAESRSDVTPGATNSADPITSYATDPDGDVSPARDTQPGEYAAIVDQAPAAGEEMLKEDDVIVFESAPYARDGLSSNGRIGISIGGGDNDTVSNYTSGEPGAYNIDVEFEGTWPEELQQAFVEAADFLSSAIVGDVPDVFFQGEVIDDIRIDAELRTIDGPGGILGQAGPTALRTDGFLPATAIMQFDIADAPFAEGRGLWDDIVLHEMMHTIGFGTIWGLKGLITGAGTNNPLYVGQNALQVFDPNAQGIPVEQDGGPGTRDSHWDEETFDNELMTGFLDQENFVSPMTIASLADLGYETAPLVADEEPLIA